MYITGVKIKEVHRAIWLNSNKGLENSKQWREQCAVSISRKVALHFYEKIAMLIGPAFFEKLNFLTSQNIVSRCMFEFASLLPEFNQNALWVFSILTPVPMKFKHLFFGMYLLADEGNCLFAHTITYPLLLPYLFRRKIGLWCHLL